MFKEISYDDFTNSARRKIAKAIAELGDRKTTIGKLLTHLDDEDAKELGQEQMELIKDYDTALDECIEKIKHGIVKSQRHKLMEKINDANTPKDEKKQLLLRVQELDKYQKMHSLHKGEE